MVLETCSGVRCGLHRKGTRKDGLKHWKSQIEQTVMGGVDELWLPRGAAAVAQRVYGKTYLPFARASPLLSVLVYNTMWTGLLLLCLE